MKSGRWIDVARTFEAPILSPKRSCTSSFNIKSLDMLEYQTFWQGSDPTPKTVKSLTPDTESYTFAILGHNLEPREGGGGSMALTSKCANAQPGHR